MKKIKMFAAVLATVLGLSMIPAVNVVTAEAAEPATYYVKYNVEKGDWLFQDNTSTSAYNDDAAGREMYYLLNNMKDGDVVVVSNDTGGAPLLDLGDVHLGSLTITNGQFTMVKVGSVDNFFANNGSYSSITGKITNAYVYLNTITNFNSEVKLLSLYYDRDNPDNAPTIGCDKKVEQVNFCSDSEDWTYDKIYDVTALSIENGVLLTSEGNYSREPVTTSTGTPAKNSSATGSSASNNSEYDDVPRTGQNNVYPWLLGAAAACFVGSGLLRKTSH